MKLKKTRGGYFRVLDWFLNHSVIWQCIAELLDYLISLTFTPPGIFVNEKLDEVCWRAQEWQLSHFTQENQTNRDKILMGHYRRARLWDGLLMRDYNTRLQFSLHSHRCCQHLSTHPVGWPWYPISLTWLRGKNMVTEREAGIAQEEMTAQLVQAALTWRGYLPEGVQRKINEQ